MTYINDVYPGQYHPRQESLQKLMHSKQALVSKYPYSNILNVDGNYQIEIPIPGIKRENIFIEVTDDHLIVRIFNQQRITEDKQPGKRMRIVRKCFIKLPDDADANFAMAKISNSLLVIELARKDRSTKNIPGNLIPY
jgi:HSP20 family molecular chaperone IbpA